jgi:hypothetical protein
MLISTWSSSRQFLTTFHELISLSFARNVPNPRGFSPRLSPGETSGPAPVPGHRMSALLINSIVENISRTNSFGNGYYSRLAFGVWRLGFGVWRSAVGGRQRCLGALYCLRDENDPGLLRRPRLNAPRLIVLASTGRLRGSAGTRQNRCLFAAPYRDRAYKRSPRSSGNRSPSRYLQCSSSGPVQ